MLQLSLIHRFLRQSLVLGTTETEVFKGLASCSFSLASSIHGTAICAFFSLTLVIASASAAKRAVAPFPTRSAKIAAD